MTLKQLEKEQVKLEGGLEWELSSRQVALNWDGNDQKVLEGLLTESFQFIDGLIALRGLNAKAMRKDTLVTLHQGILGTFLQHNSTHKSIGVRSEAISFEGEGTEEIKISYKELASYAYQEFANNLCDKEGNFLQKPISIAGWLNPGAVVRHVAFSADTSFQEPPENALVLLFAPVACYYYTLKSRLRDKRAQYALVIPEILDLESYANYREDINNSIKGYKDFYASSLGDAGLRFLTYESTAALLSGSGVPSCQVLTLGTVAWATQQKTRTDLCVVEAGATICENYKVCSNWLVDRLIEGKEGKFPVTSFARELITENLAHSQPWYTDFADKVNSNELFQKLAYEREGLYQVVQKVKSDEWEKLFVQVCHEAIRYTFGRLGEQAKKRGEVAQFDREIVRIRTGLGRCKTAQSFREFITDFWSRAGRLPTLQAHWEELIGFVMQESAWRKSRDLALLALASYPGKEKELEPDLEHIDTREEAEREDLFDLI